MGRRNYRNYILGTAILISFYYFYLFFNTTKSSASKTDYNLPKFQLLRELESHTDWRTRGLNFQPKYTSPASLESQVQQQLALAYPYDRESAFPKLIWQTWKIGLDDPSFPKRYVNYQETWNDKNPEYKHYVVPDEQCDLLIEELYSTVPEVAEAYKLLPKSIMKADFFRYLILFARGGVYTDIDTVGLKPVDSWISNAVETPKYLDSANTAGFVVGIEADPDRPDWNDWYARRIQFCQWTIQSKRGHPLLLHLISKITELTLTRRDKSQLNKVLGKDQGGDIMDWTGPGVFTDAVFEYVNRLMQKGGDTTKNVILKKKSKSKKREVIEKIVDWKLFTGMEQPILIDDVMVLPITSFSPDVNQMGAKSSGDPMAYAKHMFLGSWKDDQVAN